MQINTSCKLQCGWCGCVRSQCRRSVTSTGRRNAPLATSISWSTQWPSTTCRSTYCASSKSPTPGSVSFIDPSQCAVEQCISITSSLCQLYWENVIVDDTHLFANDVFQQLMDGWILVKFCVQLWKNRLNFGMGVAVIRRQRRTSSRAGLRSASELDSVMEFGLI